MREIVFDTETTGISPQSGDRMVEIGCIEMINRVETGQHFHAYFNPQRAMPSEAEAVHGLSAVFLSDKPLFAGQVDALLAFLGDSPLIAHNANFDFGFLNAELALIGRPPICLSRMIDTWAIARTRHPGAKHSLDALCTRYGVDRSQRVKHGALLDAQLLAQVYVELTGGRQIGFEMEATVAAAALDAGAELIRLTCPVRPPRPHAPTPVELERHAAFLSTITAPLWASFEPAEAG